MIYIALMHICENAYLLRIFVFNFSFIYSKMKGVGEAHNARSGLDIDLYIQFDQSSVTMYLNIFLILILKSIKWN